jgi:hypothetical protein
MFNSPLAEKRLAISLVKKQLIGRRAYSDSIHISKSPKSNAPSSSSSECSTAISTPVALSTKVRESLNLIGANTQMYRLASVSLQ